MPENIARWLEQLGLGEFAAAFAENRIDAETLSELTADDLKELGVAALGDRKKLLKAIAELGSEPASTPTVAETTTPGQAERRQLTVMFCDLVGSTELSRRLDPEDLREVMRQYQDTVAGLVARFEGHVAKFLGDGVLAFFGWPRAYEDQAERAVRSGLAAAEAVANLKTEDGQVLAARVGIATGQVVIGDIVGEAATDADAVAGETPNLAARLLEVASPGQVVIGTTTRLLIGEALDLEDIGTHRLKGFAEPVAAWRVLGESTAETRFEAAHPGTLTQFVGREHELGLLKRAWQQSQTGTGQVVLISGEPGIGKSRLVDALSAALGDQGYTRITLSCSPYHTNSALFPVIAHLERVLRWQREDSADVKLAKLEEALRDFSLPFDEAIPLFASLLSLALPDDRHPPISVTPQQQKQQTLDAIVAWVLEEAERQPVLQVWEDLHWADPSTLELLALEIEQAPTAPILNVLTFRPEFQPPWPQRSHMTPLTMNRLERSEVEALITLQAGGKALPEEVVEHIVGKTDGVPLYVEELTKTILEADFLRERNGSYELARQLSEVTIPATLQDSLMARLDRLPSIREVAQLGAVLGREFAYEMVQAIVSIEETTLQDGLVQLVDAELLYQRGRPPRAKYIFKHALVRDAAYQSLLKRTRQHYHRQVAELIEARFPGTVQAQPELVAHHYTEAGLPEPAIGYWRRASAHAIERSANVEAINHVGRALELLKTLPDTVNRDGFELDLQLALGAALIAPKSYAAEEVRLAFARANELCQRVGGVDQRFQAVKGLWSCHMLRGEQITAHNLARELSILAQESGDPDRLLMAQRVLGADHLLLGEYGKSLEALERGIKLYDPDRQITYLSLYGEDPGLFCYAYSTLTNYFLGHLDAASVRAEQALELAKRLPSRYALSYVLAWTASFFLQQRRLDAALECAYAAHEVAEQQSIVQWQAVAEIVIGNALSAEGQLQEGLSRVVNGLEALRTIRAPALLAVNAPMIAEAYCDCGEYTEGLKLLEEAESILSESGIGWGVSEIYRLRGNLLAASGAAPDQSEAAYREALDLARRQEAKTLELKAATDLARLWRAQGSNSEGRDLLAPIYNWFTEGFDTPNLKDAKALLEELA